MMPNYAIVEEDWRSWPTRDVMTNSSLPTACVNVARRSASYI
ncbi:MAG: hypothetical protein AVDCRST_MAG93-3891 [uncultured Chloroflexia bacterium]|uniref:Uncharacterized protein n=1 Tax=uncultured Chloroflexia bacterium TaxID=1672391 RepID=A0A6J4JYF1_9CHLR|nr:MAG: hypothetical protein AVDCRST_MAG93-3891 [uncultured Chloroflexia bacterium]